MAKRIVAGAVLAAAVLVSGCGETEGAEAQPSSSGEGEAQRTVNVETVAVQPQPFTHFIRVVGTVEAQRDVRVSAEEGGVVERVLAAKGEVLSPGEPILRLDGDVLRAQLEQATSQAALAQETWERQRQLWEQDSIGTEIQYLQARYNAESARAQARVLSERMERTSVRSPIQGILDDRMVEVGTMVSPGTPVARVLDVDTVEVVAGVPERYASDIARGAEVLVSVGALGNREYLGTVDFVGSAVDAGSRTFTVEVLVPNPGLGIKPGMVADVRIARRTLEGAIAVPRHAVLRKESGYIVYVVTATPEGPRAEIRSVQPGVSRGDQVVIEQGLEAGDRIVVVGQQQVADGDAVEVVAEHGVVEGAEAGETDARDAGDGEEGSDG